ANTDIDHAPAWPHPAVFGELHMRAAPLLAVKGQRVRNTHTQERRGRRARVEESSDIFVVQPTVKRAPIGAVGAYAGRHALSERQDIALDRVAGATRSADSNALLDLRYTIASIH